MTVGGNPFKYHRKEADFGLFECAFVRLRALIWRFPGRVVKIGGLIFFGGPGLHRSSSTQHVKPPPASYSSL